MKKIALYPGSFDPITKGHMALIEQAHELFDIVVVAIAHNTQKKAYFSLEQRHKMLSASLAHLPKVSLVSFSGLTVSFAQEIGAQCILRGLRIASDFEYEFQLAGMNRDLDQSIFTYFLPSIGEFSHISSSMTKEVLLLGGDISPFVCPSVHQIIQEIHENGPIN